MLYYKYEISFPDACTTPKARGIVAAISYKDAANTLYNTHANITSMTLTKIDGCDCLEIDNKEILDWFK